MGAFRNSDGAVVRYETVRRALEGEDPLVMRLTDAREIAALIEAVNERIDSCLESCFVPDRGDHYEGKARSHDGTTVCWELVCHVSAASLPVLLRRLEDHPFKDDDLASAALGLQSDILTALNINDRGEFVPEDE